MALLWFCGQNPGDVDFEADSRDALVKAVANHYSDGYDGPDESPSPPTYNDVGFSLDGGPEQWLTAPERATFNADIEEAFEAAIEGWDAPSDYEEHNTHHGLR